MNRTLKFTVAKYQSTVPPSGDPPGPLSLPPEDQDASFVADVNKLIQTYNTLMDSVRLREGLATVMQLSARGNIYLQGAGLNNALLASNPQRCAQVISRAINLIWVLSAMVAPFMPATEQSILKQLNAPARTVPDVEVSEGGAGVASGFGIDILEGHVLGQPEYLFTKIDEGKAEVWRTRFGSAAVPAGGAGEKDAKGKEGAKGKGKAQKKDKASGGGSGVVGAAKEKVKKVREKTKKAEEPKDAGQASVAAAAAATEEAALRKDTMEATSVIPVPSAGPAEYSSGPAVEPAQ